MRKIGISFILLNVAVILCSAAIIYGIGFSGMEGSFLPICALVAVTYVPLCLYTNIQNNKITDWIVARTVKKNVPKHNFDKPYTIYVNNATLMLDIEGGRIAYISNLNPWKFQLIYAKDIDDIKKGYKNLLNTTNYVYFQFSYHGKVRKFPTFVSRELRSIETDVVQKALKKANICVDVLNAAKYGTLDNIKIGCENKDLQQVDVVQEKKSDVECAQEILIKEDKRSINRVCGKWLFWIAGIILCINVLCRVVDAVKSTEYVQVKGTVTAIQTTKEWVRAGNRSFEVPSYIVWIEYPVEGYNYLEEISERYSSHILSKGDKVPVLYQKNATHKAYVAKKDWLTGSYLPINKNYNTPFVIAIFLLIIGFLFYTNSPILEWGTDVKKKSKIDYTDRKV